MRNDFWPAVSLIMTILMIIGIFIEHPTGLLYLMYALLSLFVIAISLYIANFIHSIYLIKNSKEFKEIMSFDTKSIKNRIKGLNLKAYKVEQKELETDIDNFISKLKSFS